ncbi:hypothetical protein V6N13_012865 [Hibiscus sabdariffa]
MWGKHPMLGNQLLHATPGLGIAPVTFDIYLVREQVYNRVYTPSSSHHHQQQSSYYSHRDQRGSWLGSFSPLFLPLAFDFVNHSLVPGAGDLFFDGISGQWVLAGSFLSLRFSFLFSKGSPGIYRLRWKVIILHTWNLRFTRQSLLWKALKCLLGSILVTEHGHGIARHARTRHRKK